MWLCSQRISQIQLSYKQFFLIFNRQVLCLFVFFFPFLCSFVFVFIRFSGLLRVTHLWKKNALKKMSIWEAWALGRKVLELSALFSTSKLNQWVSPNTIFKFHVRGLIFLWFILFVCVPLMKIIYSWFLLVFVDRTQKLPAYLLWKYVV